MLPADKVPEVPEILSELGSSGVRSVLFDIGASLMLMIAARSVHTMGKWILSIYISNGE